MSNKTSDNVANIENDVKIVKEFINYAQGIIDDMEYERPVDVTVYQKDLTSMANILAELEQKDKLIKELQEENAMLKLIRAEYEYGYENIHLCTKNDLVKIDKNKYLIEVKDGKFVDIKQLYIDSLDSIPKQKVKDKIEEYDKKMHEDAGHPHWVVADRIVMNVLQELLEGER